ncbi:hypothetical protein [Winogradskyella rapida]|uniref:Zinc-binding metallo-peptidase n=1 Tax=Winogradskyella rapida TaxID=549701 RepID=A0ABW3KN57_9FLAO
MEKQQISCFLWLVFSTFTFLGFAQESGVDTSIHKGLKTLKTDYSFKTFVSNDTLKRSDQTLENLNLAKHYFDALFETYLDFVVVLIENKLWEKHAYFPPPGMPQAIKGNIILGLGKSLLSQTVERALLEVPKAHWSTLTTVYGDPLDLDLFYRDILSIHELVHLYQFKNGTQPQRKWLQELFANMGMYAFVKAESKALYPLMDTYPNFVLKSGARMATYRTLNDFEDKYVQELSPQNYEWFQMQFYKQAQTIIDENGPSILVDLLNFLVETDLSQTEQLTDAALLTALDAKVGESVANVMRHWKTP